MSIPWQPPNDQVNKPLIRMGQTKGERFFGESDVGAAGPEPQAFV